MTLEENFSTIERTTKLIKLRGKLEDAGKIELAQELDRQYRMIRTDYNLTLENLIHHYEEQLDGR